MKKPWSITTTLRNADRLKSFLEILKGIEGQVWDNDLQSKFQILLIQNRLYGYNSTQFYNGLSQSDIDLIDNPKNDLTYKFAKSVFDKKNYQDPAMRGRQSFNPLKKIGFAKIENNKIKISDLGNYFLQKDSDIGEVFFRSFVKWQLPNLSSTDFKAEDGFNVKPFIITLHLIHRVNQLCEENNLTQKGLEKIEFHLFVPTLINYTDVNKYANEVIKFRKLVLGKSKSEKRSIYNQFRFEFVKKFLETDNEEEINKIISNLKDYGDNIIRYFRLTRFFYIRGGGFCFDIEPRRIVEVEKLLEFDDGSVDEFESANQYLDYLADLSKPDLPWETKDTLIRILKLTIEELIKDSKQLKVSFKPKTNLESLTIIDLKKYLDELKEVRRELQNLEIHSKSQELDIVNEYIEQLEGIYDMDDRPLQLEKLATLGLNALNDSIKIKPNYPVGDDNEPTFTAPAGKPDIECYYKEFNAICEVTMLKDRSQWYNEGQPVMRHLREFEDKENKETYCLFVAPSLHEDTLETFWMANSFGYKGKKQKIVPITITQFKSLLEFLIEYKTKNKTFIHSNLKELYEKIVGITANVDNSEEWIRSIPNEIEIWKTKLLEV